MSAAKKDHKKKRPEDYATNYKIKDLSSSAYIPQVQEVKLLAAPKSLVHSPRTTERKPRRLSKINTPMETHHFIFSQLGILIAALLFLGGMYWVLNSDDFRTQVVDKYLPVTVKQASFGLELNSPDDELLIFSNSVLISGKTGAKASVIIAVAGNTDHFDAVQADNEVKFQRTVMLSPGLNSIEISSFDGGNNSKTVTRSVYYSEEKLQ